ncbi:MAG TPA: SUMF1/EgtB/PvdO family nonheme iron enzyme [Chthonomonadaceae bacterium]|nr:SUMF1/EgtB/PvdO family nonheme iron enzyme [Chthonomonadaceae bacterium]
MSSQPPHTKTNTQDGAEMILIPAGSFLMGDDDDAIKDFLTSKRNHPQRNNPRRTASTESYYIYKYPVTVKQYFQFLAANPEHRKPQTPPWGWRNNDPIVNVSWDDAQDYCKWASQGGMKVHLPTEKEWEKAARGAERQKYPWDNKWDGSKCVNSVGRHRDNPETVGQYPRGASPYGVLDMAGNVWQWCEDKYDATHDYHVLRSGSWSSITPDYFRCAFRVRPYKPFTDSNNGFRCVVRTE